METTTLGVNVRLLDHRYHAVIRMIDVETKYGKIPVKQKFVNDILIQSKPEYEAAAKIASEFQVSMEEIYNQVARQLDRRNDMV
ncbi:MAG: nickel insertion protein [Chloroflexota bacterium]